MKQVRLKDMQYDCINLFLGNQAKTAKDTFTSAFNKCTRPGKKAVLWQSCCRRLYREYPRPKCELSARESWPCVLPFALRTHFHPAQEGKQTLKSAELQELQNGSEWSEIYKMTEHVFSHGLLIHLQRSLISVFLKPGDCGGAASHWELLKSIDI